MNPLVKVILYESPDTWVTTYIPKDKIDIVRDKLKNREEWFVFVETDEQNS